MGPRLRRLQSSLKAVVALDWPDFDADGQASIVASLVPGQGRAIPLVWLTVEKAMLKDQRNDSGDRVLCAVAYRRSPAVECQ